MERTWVILSFAIISQVLTVKNFAHGNATQASHGVGVTHLGESGDGSLYQVVGVGRALALGQHVLNTGALEHGTHSTTGLNTGTGSSGFHEDLGAAETGHLLVRDGGVDNRNLYEVLLGIFHALGDSCSDFVGLAETVAYDTVLVAYYDDGGKAEVTTTLGDLGHTVDGDESVLEFEVRRLDSLYIRICHSLF